MTLKLDLSFTFTDLDGDAIDGIDGTKTVAQTVAYILATTETGFDVVDANRIALALRKDGSVDLKSAEVALLEKTIRDFKALFPFCRAQIINAIHTIKTTKNPKKAVTAPAA